MMFCKKLIPLALSLAFLAGCTDAEMFENSYVKEAKVSDRTRASEILLKLPAPPEKIAVSLYNFEDLTGQFKNNDKYTDYSSAVTKGGHAILTQALLDAGNKQWFTVAERGGLNNLLQERQIIKVMRNQYRGPNGEALPELPPLLYSGMLIEGGIISYDSNVITGGAGAIYLGVGGNVKYNRDLVTVYLRAIRVDTGEVLLSVTSSKTVYSVLLGSNVLKYITFDRLLQSEAGFSLNEPVQLAVRQAIETSVYSLIMEGAINGLWEFQDPTSGMRAVSEYIARRDGGDTQPPPTAAPAQEEAQQQQPSPEEPKPVADTPAAAAAAPVAAVDARPASGDGYPHPQPMALEEPPVMRRAPVAATAAAEPKAEGGYSLESYVSPQPVAGGVSAQGDFNDPLPASQMSDVPQQVRLYKRPAGAASNGSYHDSASAQEPPARRRYFKESPYLQRGGDDTTTYQEPSAGTAPASLSSH